MRKYLLNLTLILFFLSCSKFQRVSLNPNLFFNIKLSEISQDQEIEKNNFFIPIFLKNNIISALPQTPYIYDEEIILPIPDYNIYLYFKKKEIIGIFTPKSNIPNLKFLKNINFFLIPEGRIGNICIEENFILLQIYKENTKTNDINNSLLFYPEQKRSDPSSIFIINKKEIKKDESHYTPLEKERIFESVYNIYCYNEFINIIIKNNDKYNLIVFDSNLNKLKELELSTDNISYNKEKEIVLIESIFPFLNNKNEISFFIEYSIRSKNEYKIINKIISKFQNNKMETFFKEDENFEIIYVAKNGNLYIGNNEDNSLILKIYSSNNELMEKVFIDFDFKNNYWKDYWINNNRIFSSKIENGEYKIVEWK